MNMSYAGIGKVLDFDQSRVQQLAVSGELTGRSIDEVHSFAIDRALKAAESLRKKTTCGLNRTRAPYKADMQAIRWAVPRLIHSLGGYIRASELRDADKRDAQAEAEAGVEWRTVYLNYEVSNTGLVRHKRFRRVLSPHRRQGYSRVTIIIDGRSRAVLLHRMVLAAFVGECPPGRLARHLNGDPGDNRLENLMWGTPQENADDKERHGRVARGERGGRAKLTDDNVRSIRNAAGKQRDIAAQFGVSQSTVGRILRREAWSHIA